MMQLPVGGIALGFITSWSIWSYCKKKLGNLLIKRLTILNDLPQLGVARHDGRLQGTAVICGGSVAGLLAARVCADHFEDVVIIEPESWLETDEAREPLYDRDGNKRDNIHMQKRARIVQQDHVHFFLALILVVLRRLFPDIVDTIKEFGGRILPATSNGCIGGIPACPPGLEPPVHLYPEDDRTKTFVVSRDTFERILRRVVYVSGGRIRWLTGTVTGLQVSGVDSSRIENVLVRDQENNAEKRIDAAVVIDCTGPSQSGIKWIKRLQDNSSKEISSLSLETFRLQYNPDLRYRTFFLPVLPSVRNRLPIPGGYDSSGTLYAYFAVPPKETRAFALHWTDGHRIMFLCSSWGDVELPEEPSEILDWIDTLYFVEPLPVWVREVIDILLESTKEITTSELRHVSCSWNQYNLIPDIPSNFVAIGDAVMRVNPALGQGCTKACVDVVTLDSHLRSVLNKNASLPSDFSSKFFQKQAARIATFWNSNKATDYAFDTTVPTKGETLATGRLTRGFLSQVMQLRMMGDSAVVPVMWKMRHGLGPPTLLFQPVILLKVLFLTLKQKLGLSRPLF